MRMLRGMTDAKLPNQRARAVRESEIFREPPGSGSYASSIGAAQGIEQFSGRGQTRVLAPPKTILSRHADVPVFAETDVLVVGGGPAGTAAAIAAARLGADVCWSNATITWAGFRRAGSSSGSTA